MKPRRFGRDRRGAVAVIMALAALPLFGAVGVAIDGVRGWLLASRLQSALDAAVLAGARNINLCDATRPPADRCISRDNEMRGMFWTNFKVRDPDTAAGIPAAAWRWVPFMRSVLDPPQPEIVGDPNGRSLGIKATARIPTTFSRVFGIIAGNPNGYLTLSVSLSAEAERIDYGLELALVLDVTGSMGANRTPTPLGSTSGNGTNIDALRLAAGDLVNVIYGDRDTVPNLYVSIIPYTTTVNFGADKTSWLNASAELQQYAPRSWQGCVEARFENGNDQNEATPSAAPFRPFFAASTMGMYKLPDGHEVAGDNDWLPAMTGSNGISEQFQDTRENNSVGPNRGCPALPVLAIAQSKQVVLDHIMRIRSTFRGGTMHNIGLQAGWFTLSPEWRGVWPGAPRGLPRPYGQPYQQKVLVLMTDGETAWYDWPGGAPGACSDTGVNNRGEPAGSPPLRPTACSPNFPNGVVRSANAPEIANNADYTGFGRPLDQRLGPALQGVAQMVGEINTRVANLCDRIKADDAGRSAPRIQIYTITFNVTSAAVQDRFKACASRPENHFNSPTQADLRAAFQQIGSQLATLRLTR